MKQKETDTTSQLFYEIIYHYKETSSFLWGKKSTIDGLQIKKTSSNTPDFLQINSVLDKLKNMPAPV